VVVFYPGKPLISSMSDFSSFSLAVPGLGLLGSVSSPSVLMGDVEDLIRQQTSNDTVSPRASSSYYEQYHSLNEVSCTLLFKVTLFI
jgi:hypothetical protein